MYDCYYLLKYIFRLLVLVNLLDYLVSNLSKIKSIDINLLDDKSGTLRLILYKLGKIVFGTAIGSNFQGVVLNFSNKIPLEYIPVDIVAFTLGNSYGAEYLVQLQQNGNIYIIGGNIKLVNVPFRSFCYFTKE